MTRSGPSRAAEAIVALLLPPVCREEILGDLHERYRGSAQYSLEVVCTVPLVIISRIRRTADPQVLLIQAFALYVSFLGAAWWVSRALLDEQWGLLRLGVPAAMAILGLMLEDAYASGARRQVLRLARGPMVGVVSALLSQSVLRAGNPELALPGWVALYGCAMSLLLCTAIRVWFPPVAERFQAANAPALWLKHADGAAGVAKGTMLALKSAAAAIAVTALGGWMADHLAVPRSRLIAPLLLMVIAYQLLKRD